MATIRNLILLGLSIFIILMSLYYLEYLDIWNEFSLFFPNDDRMREWVNESEIVHLFKEKNPDYEETILPYPGTRHYELYDQSSRLKVDLTDDGDIKSIHLSCSNPPNSLCWASDSNYSCIFTSSNSSQREILEYLENDLCK